MKRAVGVLVFAALVGTTVWVGLAARPESRLTERCLSSLLLCGDEGKIEVVVHVERCPQLRVCHLERVRTFPRLRFIDLDPDPRLTCGRGECDTFVHGSRFGWPSGRWRVAVDSRLRDEPLYLRPPIPLDIALEAGETYQLELVYRDELKGWPRGPFGHNCFEEDADGTGDFDGDGKVDEMRFAPAERAGRLLGWDAHLDLAAGGSFTARVLDALGCPAVIGSVDIDGDGRDELFFDTGKGMTAAVVDLLRYARGGLRKVKHVPKDMPLYVGGSNAGASGLECFRSEEVSGLIEKRSDQPPGLETKVSVTPYRLVGDELIEGDTTVIGVDQVGDFHDLNCFGLHWNGY